MRQHLAVNVFAPPTLVPRLLTVAAFSLLALLLPTSPAFAATYTISGRVTDQANNPLSGFTVAILDATTNATIISGTTDANGIYAVSVDGGTYNLQVIPPAGSGFQSSTATNQQINADITLDFVMVPTTIVQLSGTVIDQNNSPVAGVTVTISRRDTDAVVATLTTAINGTYITAIATGDYNFSFTPPSGSNLQPLSTSFTVSTSNNILNVTLSSPIVFYTLKGSLVDALNNPLPGQTVGLIAASSPDNTTGLTAQTDSNGMYSLQVPVGNYRILVQGGNVPDLASAQSYKIYNDQGVSIAITQDTTINLTLPFKRMIIHVQDLAGNPVANSYASSYSSPMAGLALDNQPASGRSNSDLVASDAAGNIIFWLFPTNQGGAYTFLIRPPSGIPAPIVSLGGVSFTTDDAVFTTTLSIGNFPLSGKVNDPSANPVAGAVLTATNTYDPSNIVTTTTDTSGNYNMSLFVGYYNIEVTPPAGSTFLATSVTNYTINDVTVLNFTLPAPPPTIVTVRGRLVDGFGNALVEQRVGLIPASSPDNTTGLTAQTDSNGMYSLQVPVGNYRLIVRGGSNLDITIPQSYNIYNDQGVSIGITQDTTIDMTLPFKKVVIHVQDLAGNPVANAGAKYFLSSRLEGLSLSNQPASAYETGDSKTGDEAGNIIFWLFPTNQSGSYSFLVSAPSNIPAHNAFLNGISFTTDDAVFTATLPIGNFPLSGKVTDPSANPVAGATVVATNGDNPANVVTTTTDTSGNYNMSLLVGYYNIEVTPPTGSTFLATSVTNYTINDVTVLNFTLPAPPPVPVTVTGTILDPLGKPVPNQNIQFYTPTGGQGPVTVTDEGGVYSLQIMPGNYRLLVSGSGNPGTSAIPDYYIIRQNLDVSFPITGNTTLNLTLPFKKVAIHVQDTNGNPVANTNLTARSLGTGYVSLGNLGAYGSSYYNSSGVTSDASGNAIMWLLPTSYIIYGQPPSESPFNPFTLVNFTFTSDTNKLVVLEFVHAPPTTVLTSEPAPNAEGNYTGPVKVTLSATALVSFTIDKIYFSLDNGPAQIYSAPFTVSGLGSHILKYWSVDNIGVYEAEKTFSINIVPANNAVPTLASLSPTAVQAGSGDFTLNVSGTNFINGSIIRWNGIDLVTTYEPATQKLSATVPATNLSSPGAATIAIFNPAPGGGISNPQVFFVTVSATSVSSAATSVASGSATAVTTGGSGPVTPNSLTANATGNGLVTVALFTSNPGGNPNFESSGAFSDVRLSPPGNFSSLTIVNCYLNGGVNLFWWNGTSWAAVSNQSYDSTTGCITVTIDNSTSPKLSDLGGTYFAAAKKLATTLKVEAVNSTYGGTINLTATLTSNGTALSSKPISFTLNGVAVCGIANTPVCPTTDNSGKANLNGIKPAKLNAGSYPAGVGASFAGDNFYNSNTISADLTVNKAVLTVTAADVTRVYGQPNPTFTVNYSGFVNGDTANTALSGSPVCSTSALPTSPVSPPNYPISCSAGTLTATNYSFNFVSGNLTINKASTTLALSSSVISATVGQPISLTASLSVVASGAGSPTGTITFKVDGVAQTPVNLAGGKASFTPANLTVGNHVVSADYSGDSSFLGSSSNELNLTISYAICAGNGGSGSGNGVLLVKLSLCDATGKNVSSVQVVVTAMDVDGNPTLLDSPGNANPNNQFRYDGSTYLFNLSTKGLKSGKHTLHFKAGNDPVLHSFDFNVK